MLFFGVNCYGDGGEEGEGVVAGVAMFSPPLPLIPVQCFHQTVTYEGFGWYKLRIFSQFYPQAELLCCFNTHPSSVYLPLPVNEKGGGGLFLFCFF